MLKNSKSTAKKIKVLVPTDFSGAGANAAAFIIELFGMQTEQIILENVYQFPKENKGTLVSIEDIISRDSKSLLEKEKKHLISEYKEANIHVISEEGVIATTIKASIKKHSTDLLVVGLPSHISKIGSAPSAFIEHAQFWPLLTVPVKSANNKKDTVIIVSAELLVHDKLTPFNYIEELSKYKNKIYVEYSSVESIKELKTNIELLLTKYRTGLLVFNTTKGDKLQTALIKHELDDFLHSCPSLLVQQNDN